jgi:hypothetical protein
MKKLEHQLEKPHQLDVILVEKDHRNFLKGHFCMKSLFKGEFFAVLRRRRRGRKNEETSHRGGNNSIVQELYR